MPSQPDITVFIPVRNCERFIGEAIESVLTQTYTDLKLVVSDNASTDGTVEAASSYSSDSRLTLVRHPTDLGAALNFNACLGRLQTDFFAILCADDALLDPNALRQARQVLCEHDGVSAVYSDLLYIAEDGRRLLKRRFKEYGELCPRLLLRRSVATLRNCFGIPLLMRRQAALGVEYDRDLTYTADVDFAYSVSAHSMVFRLPAPMVGNRYHASNLTAVVQDCGYRQMVCIARRHGIRLTTWERLGMRSRRHTVPVLRRLFLQYARGSRCNR